MTDRARDTAVLAALGVASLTEHGLRATAGPARAVWGSRLLRPARWAVDPVVEDLVRRGRHEEPRLRELARGGVQDTGEQIAEPVVAALLASPAFDRLAEEVVDWLLDSNQLERLVEHIAQMEEVRDALRAQSMGLADDVAGDLRRRSAHADDTAERVARRLLHRRPRPSGGLAPEPG